MTINGVAFVASALMCVACLFVGYAMGRADEQEKWERKERRG